MTGEGTPISPSEPVDPPAQLSQGNGQPMAGCETSKLVNGSGSPSLQTDLGCSLRGGGTVSGGHQEERCGTAWHSGPVCLEEEPKAGNGRDKGDCGQTSGKTAA